MIYLIPFISAVIGWFTNFVAVKMLFHPRKPLNLGIVKIQGVFPKRQQAFAEKIGKLVGEQLFSFDDLKATFITEKNTNQILVVVEEKMDVFLKEKLVQSMPMLAMVMGEEMRKKIKNTLMDEFREMLPEVLDKYVQNIEKDVNVVEVVQARVASFSIEKLEGIMYGIMKKEFKFIEVIGAILGALIGGLQLLLVQLA